MGGIVAGVILVLGAGVACACWRRNKSVAREQDRAVAVAAIVGESTVAMTMNPMAAAAAARTARGGIDGNAEVRGNRAAVITPPVSRLCGEAESYEAAAAT